ncbi:hypothetical protein MKW92_005092 [Papaver armeniacum]|nr:hypothetical protein MKW92_005092 [Papaver armeniacum]
MLGFELEGTQYSQLSGFSLKNNKIGKETSLDQQDNVVVNRTVEGNESELISSTDEQISDNTWNVNTSVHSSTSRQSNLDEEGVSFSQAIQSPCCTQMERLCISAANSSIPPPNLHASAEMIGDHIDFGPGITNIFVEDEVELLQRTRIHESNTLGTNADNEGKVFEEITESEDYPQIHPGFEFMSNSKSQCSSSYNEQSPPCADLGEGSESMVEKDNKDRISELPDALIHHIFSFLDIESVIQTCILARRWRYLWASVPTIKISEAGFSGSNVRDDFVALNSFINFVDRFLLLRDSSSDIQTFKLKWENLDIYLRRLELKYDASNRMATWVLPAVKHNVQVLILDIYLDGMMKLPDCLFTSCKFLTKFKFRGGGRDMTDFALPNIPMCFPRLRYLELTGVSLLDDENLTSKLFSSCPVLESLLLTNCSIKFEFSSLSLKHFKLDNYDTYGSTDDYDINVKLSAPNLTSLICKDYMSLNYALENLSSLITADIGMRVKDNYADYTPEKPKIYSELATDVREMYGARMIKFIRAVRNVTDLKLSSPGFLEVVSGSLDLLGDLNFQFCNLRFLNIVTWVSGNCMNALAYLVKISPNIQSIFLTIQQTELDTNSTGGDWIAGLSSFPWLHYLKFVQIKEAIGSLNELKFLQVLLNKAIVLEKVTLLCYKRHSPDRAAQLTEFKKMLLACPSASPGVSISIQSY